MSLHPQGQYVVPPETAKVAHAIFPTGNLCVTMATTLHEWIDRYSARIEDNRYTQSKGRREQQMQCYGEDGLYLLDAIFATATPVWLRQIPALETSSPR